MNEEKLSALALISIEQNIRRSLDMEDIVTTFAVDKAPKQSF